MKPNVDKRAIERRILRVYLEDQKTKVLNKERTQIEDDIKREPPSNDSGRDMLKEPEVNGTNN